MNALAGNPFEGEDVFQDVIISGSVDGDVGRLTDSGPLTPKQTESRPDWLKSRIYRDYAADNGRTYKSARTRVYGSITGLDNQQSTEHTASQ